MRLEEWSALSVFQDVRDTLSEGAYCYLRRDLHIEIFSR